MRRRFISKNKAIILAAMLAASMAMNGCAGTSAISQSIEASESGTQDSSKVNILSLSDTVVYAYVDSIDGKELSLTLGSMSDGTDQMPGEPGGSGQPGNNQSGGGQPGDNQSGGGQPGDNQSGGGQPGDGQPSGGQPGDGQPSGGQPGDGQTSGSRPSDKPSGDKPGDDESKSGKPDDDASKNSNGESDKKDSDSDVDANESQPAAGESKSANESQPAAGESKSADESQPAADENKSANESQPAADETQADETQTDETQPDETQSATASDNGNNESKSESSSEVFTKGDMAAVLTISDESVISQEKDGEKTSASFSDIGKGSIIEVTIDENSNITSIEVLDATVSEASNDNSGGTSSNGGTAQGGSAPGGGQSSAPTDYTAVKTYESDTDSEGETIDSTGTDENAALVSDGASVTFNGDTITRSSDESTGGDSSSFYGVGAALLAKDGTAYVKNGTITTDAAGGAGAFAYDQGTVYIAGTKISTEKDTSGGIHVAGGGTLYAWDLDVTTQGESSAAIRSDRGGGTMVVDGGSYTSNGTGSPAVYCTADITVNDAKLAANGSEGVCIEGLNTLNLFDTDLTSNMSDDSQNDTTWSVIVYQSMSGDSEVGNGTYNMVGGSLISQNGGLFYTTNTECHMLVDDVDIESSDDCEFFLRCTGNNNQRGWGTTGANGSDCTFTGIKQEMNGDVVWDSISNLNLYLTEGSSLNGAVVDDESCAGDGGDGSCSVYIDKDSTWTVTGDSTVTNLYNAGKITDANGKTVSIVGTDGKEYVKGNSSYTITVTSYSEKADMSGADSAPSYSTYEVTEPDQIK